MGTRPKLAHAQWAKAWTQFESNSHEPRSLSRSAEQLSWNIKQQRTFSNDDLLTEILLRLPTRPLLQFKSMSKCWLSFITHPSFYLLSLRCCNAATPSGLFIHRRSHINKPEYHFIPFFDHYHKPPFRTLAFVPKPSGTKILQSCNGLLCYSTSRVEQTIPKYYVCSPTTKLFSMLLTPKTGSSSPVSVHVVCLAFDSVKSPYYEADLRQIEIDSSTIRPWRVFGEPFTMPISLEFNERPTNRNQSNVYELERDYSRWVLKFRVDLDLVTAEVPKIITNNRCCTNLNYYGFNVLVLVRGEEDDDESYLVVCTKHKIILVVRAMLKN
ncbi:hypothetical protein NMG60_11012186 [Bertholletia excelsa]